MSRFALLFCSTLLLFSACKTKKANPERQAKIDAFNALMDANRSLLVKSKQAFVFLKKVPKNASSEQYALAHRKAINIMKGVHKAALKLPAGDLKLAKIKSLYIKMYEAELEALQWGLKSFTTKDKKLADEYSKKLTHTLRYKMDAAATKAGMAMDAYRAMLDKM